MARSHPRFASRWHRIRTQRHRHEEVYKDGDVERVFGDPSKRAVGFNAHYVRLHQNGNLEVF